MEEENKKATVVVEAFDGSNNKIHSSTGIIVDGKVVANYNTLDKAVTAQLLCGMVQNMILVVRIHIM